MRNNDLDLRKLLANPPVARKELPEELIHHIEQRISMNGDMNLRKSSSRTKRRSAFTSAVAAVAGIAIAAGGLYTFVGRGEHVPAQPTTGTTEEGTGLQFNRPAEVITPNWRIVIVKSLLKTGPYYDIQVFSAGKSVIQRGGLVIEWAGDKMSGEGASIQPGGLVGSVVVGGYFPKGFSNLPPIKISWIVNGQSESETISLADAKPDLEIRDYHEYQGGNQNWIMSYAYETIVGENFDEPYGELVLKFEGKNVGDQVKWTIQSTSGTATMVYHNPQGNEIRMYVDPTQKGYGIHDRQAKVSIEWTGGRDTFDMYAVQPSASGQTESSFADVSNTLAKSLSVLNHEPGVTETGFASDPQRNLIKISFGISDSSITPAHANAIIEHYLTSAAQATTGQEYKQLDIQIDIHKNSLRDRMLLTGEKRPGSTTIEWNSVHN